MEKVIGIDIGGTKINGGVITKEGYLLVNKQVLTEAKLGRNTILGNIFRLIDGLIYNDIDGIGIGSAGIINYDDGVIEYATENLPGWTGLHLKRELENKYNVPVVVDNDVNAAAMGEYWLGSGKYLKSFLMLAVGTGVGGAIFYKDDLIRGTNWSAGEIGHTVLYPNGRLCNCGQRGCLEQYLSGTAIFKRYNECSKANKVINAEEVFNLFKTHDPVSKYVLNEFIYLLSLILKNLKNTFDPEAFIIGGGLIGSKDLWWDDFILTLDKGINVKAATLGNSAAMFGAAKLIINHIENRPIRIEK